MFRKLLLAGVACVGVLSPVAVVSANAREFHRDHRPYHRVVRHYEHAVRVFYSDPCRPGWVCAGTFDDYRAAQQFAEQYRCRGFAISIR